VSGDDLLVTVDTGGLILRYRCDAVTAECFRQRMHTYEPLFAVTIAAGDVTGLKEIPCARLYFEAAR
jgi:hypothetical protein